jgi:hypothetical protein
MAFNIQDWKSTTVGFLRPSNFLVYIYPPAWALRDGGTQKWNGPDLAYLTASTALPGLQILTTESRLYGQGPMVKMPYDVGVTDITLKFYADATGKSMAYMYDWLRNVVNLSHVQNEDRSGAFSNQISYKSDYITKIDIMLYQDMLRTPGAGPQDGSLMIYSLYDAYPISISETSLDWQAGNEIMTFNVTFTYRSFEYDILGPASNPSFSQGTAAPADLTYKKPQSTERNGGSSSPVTPTDLASQTTLVRVKSFAGNVREQSQNIRMQSVSVVKQIESTIYNNEYIKTAREVVGAVSDVRKTLGVLSNLNNSFKNSLKQQLKSVTGGKSLKNIF